MSPSHLHVKLKIRLETINYLLKIKTFGHLIKFLILSFVMALLWYSHYKSIICV